MTASTLLARLRAARQDFLWYGILWYGNLAENEIDESLRFFFAYCKVSVNADSSFPKNSQTGLVDGTKWSLGDWPNFFYVCR